MNADTDVKNINPPSTPFPTRISRKAKILDVSTHTHDGGNPRVTYHSRSRTKGRFAPGGRLTHFVWGACVIDPEWAPSCCTPCNPQLKKKPGRLRRAWRCVHGLVSCGLFQVHEGRSVMDYRGTWTAVRGVLAPSSMSEAELQAAVSAIRTRSPESTVKQIHGALIESPMWASVTFAEAKRANSKAVKASKQKTDARQDGDAEQALLHQFDEACSTQAAKAGYRKSRRRPLGWSEVEDGAAPTEDREECLQFCRRLREAGTEEQAIAVLDSLCTSDEPQPGEPMPQVDAEVLSYALDSVRQPVEDGGLGPDWEVPPLILWRCSQNDFSGDALRVLLRAGGVRRVNEWCPDTRTTPLSAACSRGNVQGVRVLLDECERAGVQLQATKLDSTGTEALFWAAQATANNMALGSVSDFAEILALLQTAGSDLETVSWGGATGNLKHTALMRVTELGEKVLVRKCIELGADPSRPCPALGGMTPLHKAVESGYESVVTVLLAAGADTRATLPDVDPKTGLPQAPVLPIAYSLAAMNLKTADLLLREEARRGLDPTPSSEREGQAFLVSNMTLICQQVEAFRRTGSMSGTLDPSRVFDMRAAPGLENTRAYEAQAAARARERDAASPARQCSGCGVFSSKLKDCSACRCVSFCSEACFRRAWKAGHKHECALLAKGSAPESGGSWLC